MLAVILQIIKPIWEIVFKLAILLILCFISINITFFLAPLFGAFGYSDMDLHNLKGWNGFWKIWRAFNRTYILDGLFLSLFSSTTYTKDEIQDETLTMQNFAQIFKIFATAALIQYFSGKAKLSNYAILKATILRFLIISCLSDLILNTVFYKKPNSGESDKVIAKIGKDMEVLRDTMDKFILAKEEEEIKISEYETELKPLNKDLKQSEKDKKKKKKKAEAVQRIKELKPKIEQLEAYIKASNSEMKRLSKLELITKKKLQDKKTEYKDLRYSILVEEREISPFVKNIIPEDSDGPNGPNKPIKEYKKKIEDGSLVISYIIAAFINVLIYSTINNKDRKPLQITLITILITIGLILPFMDIVSGKKSDFDDFSHKESTLQNLINKYHPNSMNPKAKTVKAGYDYDPYYTTQAIVFVFSCMMILLHLFFAIWEAPKDLEDCNKGPLKSELATVSVEPDKELQVCPEDRKMYGDLGYYPQSIYKRFLGGMQQKARYEILYAIVPCIAGIIEGKTAFSEARRAGITSNSLKSELKRKGFNFGYWRAVIVILFASKLLNKEALAAFKAKAAGSIQSMRKGAGQRKGFNMPSFMKKK